MRELKQLSNSALDRFTQCPLSFFFQYLDPNRPVQENVVQYYADFGNICHFMAEMFPRTNYYMDFPYRPSTRYKGDLSGILASYSDQLMARKKPFTLEEMKIIYDELFFMIEFPTQEVREEYYTQGLAFIDRIPTMDWSKVIGLEQEFKIDLQNGVVPITGFIDKLERDDKGLIVTDYKTSKPYSQNAILKKHQLPIYGMACYILYGELPYKYRYDFVRFNKTVEVEVPIERLTEVKNIMRFKYMQIVSYMKTGKFPANYTDFYCRQFCGFSHLCPRFQEFNSH